MCSRLQQFERPHGMNGTATRMNKTRAQQGAKMGTSVPQGKVIAPVVAYFETKRIQRENRDLADKRFICSVQELLRAEEQDQSRWAETRRCRVAAAGVSNGNAIMVRSTITQVAKNIPHGRYPRAGCHLENFVSGEKGSASSLENSPRRVTPVDDHSPNNIPEITPLIKPASRRCQRQQRSHKRRERGETQHQQQQKDNEDHQQKQAQATAKIGQLRSSLPRAPPHDAPNIAQEIAMLYLELSGFASALVFFRMALKPAPEPIPTKQEIDRKEAQTRKLMLLDKDARAKVLAAMQAEEVEVKRERERLEAIRIHRAATGVYECLLELKQPVAAAEAARMRLAMCDDGFDDDNGDLGTGSNTRLQVEMEIHRALLRQEGLIEAEATNQGAWLTESAGALADLHASILQHLCEFQRDGTAWKGINSGRSMAKHGLSAGGHRLDSFVGKAGGGEARNGLVRKGCTSDRVEISSFQSQRLTNEGSNSAYGGEYTSATTGNSKIVGELMSEEKNRRSRLRDLGRMLARKRQFTASREAFEAAICGGPEEAHVRARHRCRTKGFYLDTALDEASPSMHLRLVSRWQGGVKADEIRRRHLLDGTGFTGVHRGAETLVVDAPAGGWANDASDLAYADRISRARIAVCQFPKDVMEKEEEDKVSAGENAELAGDVCGDGRYAQARPSEALLLGHKVAASDVVLDT